MSRRSVALLTASLILATLPGMTACTNDGSVTTADMPAGSVDTAAPSSSGTLAGTGSTVSTGLPTVAEAQARFATVLGPDVAIEWGPDLAPPCIATMQVDVPPDAIVLFGQVDTTVPDEGGAEALMTRFEDAGARVIPSVDSHAIVLGDGWEALAVFILPEDGATGTRVTVDLMVAVADAPIPDGFTAESYDCDTKTTTSKFEAVGSALPAEGE